MADTSAVPEGLVSETIESLCYTIVNTHYVKTTAVEALEGPELELAYYYEKQSDNVLRALMKQFEHCTARPSTQRKLSAFSQAKKSRADDLFFLQIRMFAVIRHCLALHRKDHEGAIAIPSDEVLQAVFEACVPVCQAVVDKTMTDLAEKVITELSSLKFELCLQQATAAWKRRLAFSKDLLREANARFRLIRLFEFNGDALGQFLGWVVANAKELRLDKITATLSECIYHAVWHWIEHHTGEFATQYAVAAGIVKDPKVGKQGVTVRLTVALFHVLLDWKRLKQRDSVERALVATILIMPETLGRAGPSLLIRTAKEELVNYVAVFADTLLKHRRAIEDQTEVVGISYVCLAELCTGLAIAAIGHPTCCLPKHVLQWVIDVSLALTAQLVHEQPTSAGRAMDLGLMVKTMAAHCLLTHVCDVGKFAAKCTASDGFSCSMLVRCLVLKTGVSLKLLVGTLSAMKKTFAPHCSPALVPRLDRVCLEVSYTLRDMFIVVSEKVNSSLQANKGIESAALVDFRTILRLFSDDPTFLIHQENVPKAATDNGILRAVEGVCFCLCESLQSAELGAYILRKLTAPAMISRLMKGCTGSEMYRSALMDLLLEHVGMALLLIRYPDGPDESGGGGAAASIPLYHQHPVVILSLLEHLLKTCLRRRQEMAQSDIEESRIAIAMTRPILSPSLLSSLAFHLCSNNPHTRAASLGVLSSLRAYASQEEAARVDMTLDGGELRLAQVAHELDWLLRRLDDSHSDSFSPIRAMHMAHRELLAIPPLPWSKFSNLSFFDVRFNVLQCLPVGLASVPKLSLRLSENPFGAIPFGFRSAQWTKLKAYLEETSKTASSWRRNKIMCVGEEGVGKSTLLQCFIRKKAKVPCKENISTDGIEVTSGITLGEDCDVVFDAWDFGGQEVYYPTHQFFLTSASVFIVTFSLAQPQYHRIEYWMQQLKSMRHNAARSPVVIVGTHLDDPLCTAEHVDSVMERLDLMFPKYRYPNIARIMKLSSKSGDGVMDLKRFVADRAKQSIMSVEPQFVQLYEYIERQRSKSDYVSWDTYLDWCTSCGVLHDVPQATQFLRSAGAIIHFPDRIGGLSELVVLNPSWLAGVMSALITTRHRWIQNGLLSSNKVRMVFENYPLPLHSTLVGVLLRFNMVIPLRQGTEGGASVQGRLNVKSVNSWLADFDETTEGNLLVPSVLGEAYDVKEFLEWWPNPVRENLALWMQVGRVYEFPFMPLGLFGRVIARTLALPQCTPRVFWRNGLVVTLHKQVALLRYDEASYRLHLLIRSRTDIPPDYKELAEEGEVGLQDDSPHAALLLLVDMLETLLECCYPNLNTDVVRMIPCSHCFLTWSLASDPFMFTLTECMSAAGEGRAFVYCNHLKIPSRRVRLDMMAPDIAFSDLPIIPQEKFTDLKRLTVASMGSELWRAEYEGKMVVIKKIARVATDVRKFGHFQREAYITSCLVHPNLVVMYGLAVNPLRMVLEYAPEGDLSELLFRHVHEGAIVARLPRPPEEQPNWRFRLRVALDLAKGIEFLHSSNPPVLHRDVHLGNVFLFSKDVDAPVVAKIADFGSARVMFSHGLNSALRSWEHVAPEVFGAKRQAAELLSYNEFSDVYSFALVLYQLMTCSVAYEEFLLEHTLSMPLSTGDPDRPTEIPVLLERGLPVPLYRQFKTLEMKEAIRNGLRPSLGAVADYLQSIPLEELPLDAAFSREELRDRLRDRVSQLISRCWANRPGARPLFPEIVATLKEIVGDVGMGTGASLPRTPRAEEDASQAAMDDSAGPRPWQPRYSEIVKEYMRHELLEEALKPPYRATVVLGILWLAYRDGTLALYDMKNNMERVKLWKFAHRHEACGISLVGSDVWVLNLGREVQIFDAKSMGYKASLMAIPRAAGHATCMLRVFTQRADHIWIASSNREIRIWCARSRKLVSSIKGLHDVSFRCMEQEAERVWVGCDGMLYVYDANSFHLLSCVTAPIAANRITRGLDGVMWIGGRTGSLEWWRWKGDGPERMDRTQPHDGRITCLQLSGKYMWSASWDSRVVIWDADRRKALQEVVASKGYSVNWLAVCDDGVVSLSKDWKLIYWRYSQRKQFQFTTARASRELSRSDEPE